MQLVSPAPGTLASARAHLSVAQGAAANVANDPYTRTMDYLFEGVRAAERSAQQLLVAEPRSQYQDLGQARQHVLDGKLLLEQAISRHGSAAGVDHGPDVKLLAGKAFDAFEQAFEVIDND